MKKHRKYLLVLLYFCSLYDLLAPGCVRPNLFDKDVAVSPSSRTIQKENTLLGFKEEKVFDGLEWPRRRRRDAQAFAAMPVRPKL